MLHEEITGPVISAFYEVHKALGFGFLEKVYENALAVAPKERGLRVWQQAPITVYFHGITVGEYFADLIVEDRVILELKIAEKLNQQDVPQLLNYLRASPIEVGLLLNFGHEAHFRRLILTNDKKPFTYGKQVIPNIAPTQPPSNRENP